MLNRRYAVVHEASVRKPSLSGGARGAGACHLITDSYLDKNVVDGEFEVSQYAIVRGRQTFGGDPTTHNTAKRGRIGSQLRLLLIDETFTEAPHRDRANNCDHDHGQHKHDRLPTIAILPVNCSFVDHTPPSRRPKTGA